MAKKLPRGIRENKGTYEARAMINGIKITLYGSDLKALIEEFTEAKEKAKSSQDYRKNRITLNEWFEEWFSTVKAHRVKETSINPMKNNFKRTFGFYIGSKKIRDIKPMDVQQALNTMEKDGISNSAMREALGRLRECMDFALGSQMISVNPCLIVEVPWTYKKAKEEIALTQEEQNEFLNEGKITEINRSLSCSYYNGVKREILVTPKTVNSTRPIPFMGEIEDILKSQREKQARLKKELGDRWRGKEELGDLVFTTSMGSPCSRYIVEKEIKKVIKRMREKEAVLAVQEHREPKIIRDFHPHTIRHTFATRCFEKKMEPKVVQKLMGHSSISITMNIYTHVLENKMNEEIQKFGSANTEQTNPYADLNIPKRTITAMSHC